MTKDNPTVSIVTACYNSEKYVAECIESVRAQGLGDFEHILVDDGSSDKTVEIIKKYSQLDPRIRLHVLEKNSGPAVARNKAIELARGRYIAFLDSDDVWLPHKLERQIDFMNNHGVALSYHAYEARNQDLSKVVFYVGTEGTLTAESLLKQNNIGLGTAIYDLDRCKDKFFMPLIRMRQDLGLWLKFFDKGLKVRGMPEALMYLRLHSGSLTKNKKNAALFQWKFYRKVRGLGLLPSTYYFIHYVLLGFKKYYFRN